LANVYTISTRRKSDPDEYRDPRARHIEEWVRASEEYRKDKIGEKAFKDAEELYCMKDQGSPSPSFRPMIRIPMLQRIMLEEANQISDTVPQIYIFSDNRARDKEREKALQAQWYSSKVNQHTLMASLTARYCGTGFLVAGFDPDLRNGKGGMWVKSIDPRLVGFDPATDYTWDPSYAYYGTWMNIDDVRLRWPVTSKHVRPRNGGSPASPIAGDSGYGMQMPSGPMASIPGMPFSGGTKRYSQDTSVLVRHVFCKDYTREMVDNADKPLEAELIDPEMILKYPNGRWLVECEGVILSDGPNPYPRRSDIMAPHFPIFPVWALPALHGGWGTPVTSMTVDMQLLAQRLYTQAFENCIRLNNGVWFIPQNTGIDPEAFGGLPGEVVMINQGSQAPTCVAPNALSASAMQVPEKLLQLQNQVLGFGEARQGNPGAGNISTDLYDASVLQSSGLLQLSGRLMAGTLQMLGEFMFYTMGRYMGRQNMPLRGNDGVEMAEWQGLIRPDQYDVMLDEASIRPLSNAVVRKMTPDLMKTGIVATERGLRTLGYPGAEEIAEEQRHNLELQALGRVKGGKK
jgi:hypothetical protein